MRHADLLTGRASGSIQPARLSLDLGDAWVAERYGPPPPSQGIRGSCTRQGRLVAVGTARAAKSANWNRPYRPRSPSPGHSSRARSFFQSDLLHSFLPPFALASTELQNCSREQPSPSSANDSGETRCPLIARIIDQERQALK